MLRFRIGSIPVEVRPSHLLVAALLAYSWMPGARAGGSSLVPAVIVGGAVVFISILVHELGHALVARLYGYQPEIVIEWFGGHTRPNADGPLPWGRDLLLTAAGPLFGLGLGIASGVALWALEIPLGSVVGREGLLLPLWAQALGFFFVANLVWAVLNMVPVLPLDGGRISHVLFTRVLGPRGVVGSQGLALVICVAVVAWAASNGELILVLFFVMWGFGALQALTAFFNQKGKGAASSPHPTDLAYAQAAALFSERRFKEAGEVARRALRTAGEDLPQKARARLHHLLGWVALKEGDGREALDAFSRMEGESVEPQALAAAFALVGDDARALGLWELGYRTGGDPTVKVEWAGTLLRLGREEEARKLAGDRMRDAWRAAETTLIQRGDYEGAARIGLRALEEVPGPELAYDTACSLARAGKVDEALRILDRAYELGFRGASHAQADPDLAALRHTPAFTAWLSRVKESAPR